MKDLIDECGQDLASCGYETVELKKYKMTASKLFVDTAGKAKKLGFEKGHYFILNAPLLGGLMDEHRDLLVGEIAYRLEFLFKENKIKKKDKVLCVGIGNPEIVADCFGVWTANKIEVDAFKKSNRIFKVVPNTFINTGINAYDIIHLLVQAFDISAVVLFDSLATNNISRIGTSIQFNDAGLTPGSALNNFGKALNKTTLGVPCIAIGVPMMISAQALGQKIDLILTEKDAREKVKFLSSVVAECVNVMLRN